VVKTFASPLPYHLWTVCWEDLSHLKLHTRAISREPLQPGILLPFENQAHDFLREQSELQRALFFTDPWLK
jgi:hypothetical protein